MNIFSDVPITHPYYIHVHFMAGKNFMIGYGSNVFGVNDQLTRSQAAVVLSKIFNWDTTPPQAPTFVDVPTTHLYYAQIEAMHRLGITSGCSINPRRYCPDDLITRKQLTTFIIKSANLDYSTAPASPYYDDVNQNDYAYPAIQLATQRQVIEACRLSPRHFCPESSVSRGEAAKLFTLAYNSFI
jgi:5'-nucleotidase / UDP-sugar diphosphatase